jgi:PilZ domain
VASFINTRKWPRLPIAFPVFVRSTDENGKTSLEFATAINVSAGGVLLAVRKSPKSRHLSLEIPVYPGALPEGQNLIRFIEGDVVRTEKRDRYSLVGMKFDTPLPVFSANESSSVQSLIGAH